MNTYEMWKELQKLNGTTADLRDLHDAVDGIQGARVVPVGRISELDGVRLQVVRIVRHGFRPVTLTARAKIGKAA